eukprot:m.212816 g.212816  ORF g.212816 m.212816 type:complete len:300 (-) comp26162_c2_seq1:332-1231(-)
MYRPLWPRVHSAIFIRSGLDSHLASSLWYNDEHIYAGVNLRIGLPQSSLSLKVTKRIMDDTKLKFVAEVGLVEHKLSYGVERKVDEDTAFSFQLKLSSVHGVSLRGRLERMQQVYQIPIELALQVTPSAVIAGTLFPALLYGCIQHFIIRPYLERKQKKETEERKKEMQSQVEERKREAMAATKLMKQVFERKVRREIQQKGLLILGAFYGRLHAQSDSPATGQTEWIDVTIPLQCLVSDSRLELHEGSKALLLGFYDPCPLEDKHLLVRYQYRQENYQVTIADEEELRLPPPALRTMS